MIEIRNYEVVINEELKRCALIVNEKDLSVDVVTETLEYEVVYKEAKILVFEKNTNKVSFIFVNADKELLAAAIRSNGFPLCIGTVKGASPVLKKEVFVEMK